MIYILLANGASSFPQFIPVIPQLLLVLCALWSLIKVPYRPTFLNALIVGAVVLLLAFSLILNVPEEGLRFAKILVNALVSFLLVSLLNYRYGNNFPEVYSRAILFITVAAVAGLLLTTISDWHVSSSIGERQYNTNFLTTWLIDDGFNSSRTEFSPFPYRLQAMFDEPGTYGMLLVPAFFYFFHSGNSKSAALLLVGVFLTESANAWALCFLILMGRALSGKLTWPKLLFWLVLAASAISLSWSALVQLYEIKSGLDPAYENASSFSVRAAEYGYVIDEWYNHLLPLQNRQVFGLFPSGISVSYITWYLNAGIIFVIILFAFCIALFIKLLNGRNRRDSNHYFSVVLAAVMLLSGFQRTSFLDNILFMSLTFWAFTNWAPKTSPRINCDNKYS